MQIQLKATSQESQKIVPSKTTYSFTIAKISSLKIQKIDDSQKYGTFLDTKDLQ